MRTEKAQPIDPLFWNWNQIRPEQLQRATSLTVVHAALRPQSLLSPRSSLTLATSG